MFFYQNLGQALTALTNGPSQRETWARAKTILHFFCLEFQPQDCDLILGSGDTHYTFSILDVPASFLFCMSAQLPSLSSGMLQALAQFLRNIDQEYCCLMTAAMVRRLRVWASHISLYLSSFLLSNVTENKRQHQLYVLASSVGKQMTGTLQSLLLRISGSAEIPGTTSCEELWPLQLGNPRFEQLQSMDQSVYHALDVLNVLSRIASESSACTNDSLLFLIRALRSSHTSMDLVEASSLPSVLQLGIVRLLHCELPHHDPKHSELAKELLLSYGDAMLPFQLLRKAFQPSAPTSTAPTDNAADTTTDAVHLASSPPAIPSCFRRIGVLLCTACRYLEFPSCASHKCLLTHQVGEYARCSHVTCDVGTQHTKLWQKCLDCKKATSRPTAWWLISAAEATFCAQAIKASSMTTIPHEVFVCEACHVCEFPGTADGGLALNVEGHLFDKVAQCFLHPDLYSFTHASKDCPGKANLIPVRLSKNEAAGLSKLISTTPRYTSSQHGPKVEKADRAQSMKPWAHKSWKSTSRGRALLTAEMVILFRSLLVSKKSPDPMKLWRDTMLALVKSGIRRIPDVLTRIAGGEFVSSISSLQEQQDLFSSSIALCVLGGYEEVLREGCQVEVSFGKSTLRGSLVSFDKLMTCAKVSLQHSPVLVDFPIDAVRPVPQIEVPALDKLGLIEELPLLLDCLTATPPGGDSKAIYIFSHIQRQVLNVLAANLGSSCSILTPPKLAQVLMKLREKPRDRNVPERDLRVISLALESAAIDLCGRAMDSLTSIKAPRAHSSVCNDDKPKPSSSTSEERKELSAVAESAGDDILVHPVMPAILQQLNTVVMMGFSEVVAKYALAINSGDMEATMNFILTGQVFEENMEEAEYEWTSLLDRLDVRDAVEAYNSSQNFLRAQDEDQAVNFQTCDKKVQCIAAEMHVPHGFSWSTESDTHSIKEKVKTSDVSKAEQQEAHEMLLSLHVLGRLLQSRVLISQEAASAWSQPEAVAVHTLPQYRVGDILTIIDLVNKVCPAEVMEVIAAGHRIYIHYTGWSKKWDE
jgi:hypothetical protein